MNRQVSIIIPCYNAERYIGDAIRSALGQTYQPVEVIVIDDGSTDGSVQVIKSFGDAIRWETGPNRGGCAARNRGIELARGEFIQFLDADDLLHPEKLALQVPLMAQEIAAVIVCDWDTHPIDKPEERERCGVSIDTDDAVEFALCKIPFICGPIHRTNRLRGVGGFRTDLSCAQDYDLLLRLACDGFTLQHLPQVLFTRRQVSGSVSSSSVKVLRQFREVLWHSYRLLESRGGISEKHRRAFAASMAGSARALVRYGEIEAAAQMFADARQMSPATGIDGAYGTWTRWVQRALGPVQAERLLMLVKQVLGRGESVLG